MPKKKSVYPECRHILSNGCKCHSPALTGRPFCHHHSRQRNIAGRNHRSINSVELPQLEDQSSILIAIDQVVFALTHGRIEDKLARRLLYAIQLAQNAINRMRTEEIDPAEMVTDYVDGRFGDIAAPAEPGETEYVSSTGYDDFPLLSETFKTHSGHGDTCWEPTNADYPDHVEKQQQTPAENESALAEPVPNKPVPSEPAVIEKSSTHPQQESCHPDTDPEQHEGLGEGSAVAFPASSPANESASPSLLQPAAERVLTPAESNASNLASKFGPGGTVDNSPGRQSRGQEPNPNPEVPEGRPNPAPPKPGPQKSGPWDNPLLDHIVHQLQSGMTEREVAAQLARDLRAGNAPA